MEDVGIIFFRNVCEILYCACLSLILLQDMIKKQFEFFECAVSLIRVTDRFVLSVARRDWVPSTLTAALPSPIRLVGRGGCRK